MYDDEETDRPLAAADNIDFVGESQPRTSPESLGAAETPTFEAANSTAGRGIPRNIWNYLTGNCGGERAFARGPVTVVSDGRFSRCGLDSGDFSAVASSHRKPS